MEKTSLFVLIHSRGIKLDNKIYIALEAEAEHHLYFW